MPNILHDENIRLKRAVKELAVLNELATQISTLKSIDEIISKIVEKCIKHIEVEQAVVSLMEKEKNDKPLQTMIRRVDKDQSDVLPIRLNTQLSGWILKSNKPLIINNLKIDKRFKGCEDELNSVKSILGVPLSNKGEIIGILTTFNKKNNEDFTEEDARLLTIIGSQSAQLIENARLMEEEKALIAFREEIRMAREIQRKLLPSVIPKIDGFDIAGVNIPAKEVGGDYYDFLNIESQKYAFCLGDITGKGLPAAMLMSNLQATFRGQIMVQKNLKECIANSNSLLYHSTDPDKFATFFGAILDSGQSTITYCNAGHDNPIYFKADGTISRLTVGGLLLGFMDNNLYEQETLQLKNGEILLIFSDGITEAMDEEENEFGENKLINLVYENIDQPAQKLMDKIISNIRVHAGKQIQSDDITLVLIKKSN